MVLGAFIIVLVGAIVRLVWIRSVHPPGDSLFSDMGLYVEQAKRIAEGGGLRSFDVFQAPGTHLLLAGIFTVFGTGSAGMGAATAAWWLMSSITPIFLGLFVGELAGRRAGALAAAICALWPLYISYMGYFLGETPGTFFVALTMFLLVRAARADGGRRLGVWAGAGAAAAATLAIRPNLAVVFLAATAFGLLGLRRNWRGIIAASLAGAVVLSGVVVHNSIAKGRLTGLGGNSGNVFFHGQCHARDLVVVNTRNGEIVHTRSSIETQHDRGRDYVFWIKTDINEFLFQQGMKCIKDHGLGQFRYWGENILDGLWATTPFPQNVAGDWTRGFARISNNIYSSLLCLLVVASVLELVRRRRRREPVRTIAFLLATFLLWVPLAVVFFGAPRYRQPFDLFAMALFATLVAGELRRSSITRSAAATQDRGSMRPQTDRRDATAE